MAQFYNPVDYTYDKSLEFFEKLAEKTHENNIPFSTEVYGKSTKGEELKQFVIGDTTDEKAEHIFILSNLRGNQTSSSVITEGIVEKLLQDKKMQKNVVYHIIPQPNPDNAKLAQEGIQALFDGKMTEEEKNFVAHLYYCIDNLAINSKGKFDYRKVLCNGNKEERIKLLKDLLAKNEEYDEKCANIYSRLTCYLDQQLFMYNLLNKENSKLIGKKVSDLSEEEKKNLKDYFQNKKDVIKEGIINYYQNLLDKREVVKSSENTPSTSEFHVNAEFYSEDKPIEQKYLHKLISDNCENTNLILNVTGPGKGIYWESPENKAGGMCNFSKLKELKFVDKGSQGNKKKEPKDCITLCDFFRNCGLFPVVTIETSTKGTQMGPFAIYDLEKQIQATQTDLSKFIQRVRLCRQLGIKLSDVMNCDAGEKCKLKIIEMVKKSKGNRKKAPEIKEGR